MQLKTAEIFAAVKTSSAHCGPVGSGGTLHSSVCSTCFSTLHGIVVTVSTIFCIANVAAGRTMGSTICAALEVKGRSRAAPFSTGNARPLSQT
ncbi:hypothetical protein GQ600_10866 [Phytophthora cactorum]|nr:hypothetical protein GQ600_10866 [Phytophthora cactorum]